MISGAISGEISGVILDAIASVNPSANGSVNPSVLTTLSSVSVAEICENGSGSLNPSSSLKRLSNGSKETSSTGCWNASNSSDSSSNKSKLNSGSIKVSSEVSFKVSFKVSLVKESVSTSSTEKTLSDPKSVLSDSKRLKVSGIFGMSDKSKPETSGESDKPTVKFTSVGNSGDSVSSNLSESAIAVKSGNSKSIVSTSGESCSLSDKSMLGIKSAFSSTFRSTFRSAFRSSLIASDCHEKSSSYSSKDSSSSKLTASNNEGKDVSFSETSSG